MTKGLFYASFAVMLLTIGVILSISVHAESSEDYLPDWYQSWDGTRSSILETFWNQINLWDSDEGYDLKESADFLGWYKGTNFDVQNWEKEVCLMDLSTDVRSIRSKSSSTSNDLIYTTTVSISAKKSSAVDGSYLYELSYYLRPFNSAADYKVYLYKKSNPAEKYYLIGTKTNSKMVAAGKSIGGFEAKYIKELYDTATIEFIESQNAQFLEANIN